jgi:hypothetical protein
MTSLFVYLTHSAAAASPEIEMWVFHYEKYTAIATEDKVNDWWASIRWTR